jgi:hypothetical protein
MLAIAGTETDKDVKADPAVRPGHFAGADFAEFAARAAEAGCEWLVAAEVESRG